jgi:ATP-dependent RNA helicase DeaD
VLDEADEMLNQGFLPDIEFVFSCMVHEHHTMLFSATMPEEIKRLSKHYLNNAVTIELISEHKAPSSLIHQFQLTQPHHRFDKLVELIESEKPAQAIVFSSSRNSCEKVYDQLKKKVDSVEQIHGGLDQNRRTSLFRRFKKLDIRFLVATDIASRGLDFSHTTHIFNYDLPHNPEAYTHRTGRTARMGREGKAITFVTPKDLRKLNAILKANRIERMIGEAPDLISGGKSRGGQRPGGSRRGGGQGRSQHRRPRGRRPSDKKKQE